MDPRGKTVLVTRQSEQAAEFVDELARIGARALVVPMIRVTEPDSWEECDRAIARIGSYDGLVFASANGVKAFFKRAVGKGVDPQSIHSLGIYAVGRKTQEIIEEQGYTVRFIPDNFSAESLVAGLAAWDVNGKRFLFPRGNLGRDELISGLQNRGAVVDVVEVYKNVGPEQADGEQLWHKLSKGEIDVLTFASPSAVVNFSRLVSPEQLRSLGRKIPLAVIGPATREAALKKGYDVDIVGMEATVRGLVKAIARYLRR